MQLQHLHFVSLYRILCTCKIVCANISTITNASLIPNFNYHQYSTRNANH
jgi:hypothetical protein